MSFSRKRASLDYGAKSTVDEIFEGITMLSVVICFLLILFIFIWIAYVIWKISCRRSSVVDQNPNHDYFELDLTSQR